MRKPQRWDMCVSHFDQDVVTFITQYFSRPETTILFIAAAGFDPRSTVIAQTLAAFAPKIRALFIREQRANPPRLLVQNAEAHARILAQLYATHTTLPIQVFGTDGAVVGGRRIVAEISNVDLNGISDIIVDISALSSGISFPLIRYLVEFSGRNVHVFLAHDSLLDDSIHPNTSDKPSLVHGFKGNWALDAGSASAVLWLPQLARGRKAALSRIHEVVKPHDTCPIIPFPASNPRQGDDVLEYFQNELENTWEVDARNIVYAAENDPIDVYRTILQLDDLRTPVFAESGGSKLVLSPLGSKVLALGSMMAAIERELPIVYVEALGYEIDGPVATDPPPPKLLHLWLSGSPYPNDMTALIDI